MDKHAHPPQKRNGNQRNLARKLEHIARFEKGKQEKGFLTLKSINTDIINLRKEFLEKEEEAKKRKKNK